MKFTRRIGNWRIGVIFHTVLWKTTFCGGMTSDVYSDKGEHVIFWDFERNPELPEILTALHKIQKQFKLGDIHIFKSGERKSFRAICLSKRPLKEMVTILRMTPFIDLAFLKWTMIRCAATIRITPKQGEEIKYLGKIGSETKDQKSFAHSKVLKHFYGVPIDPSHDQHTTVRFVKYETRAMLKDMKHQVT